MPASAVLAADAQRLLHALAARDAHALPALEHEGRLAVVSSRGGMTLRTGTAARSSAEMLADAGLAAWDAKGARLALTAEGRARVAREEASGTGLSFRAQHGSLAMETRRGEPVRARERDESPLAWLARRKDRNGLPMIDAAMLEAGERLRRDITFAGLLPSVTSRWDGMASPSGSGGGGAGHFTEATLAARQRIDHALEAVGPEMAGLLLDVCGFLKGIETIERERQWPVRSAKLVLRLALGQLARHYGLASEARGKAASVLRAWAAPGARPGVDGAAVTSSG